MTHISPSNRRCANLAIVSAIACLAMSNVAYAQRGGSFYFGPEGFGYGYQSRGVGIYIGPQGYRYDDRQHDDDRYYDDVPRYEYYEEGDYGTPPYEEEPAPRPAVVPTNEEAAEYQQMAEDAFHANELKYAIKYANHALIEDPKNGKLHLFMGQLFFASGKYAASAAALHRGMSLLNEDDWGFVVKNYTLLYEGDNYIKQMNSLVAFIKKNPDAPYAYFVRGYQYGFLGHEKAGRKDMAKALELESRDKLAGELLVAWGGRLPEEIEPGTQAAKAPEPVGE